MNISKKGKVITLFTIAVMCIAIVTTACLIFTPNYKGDDVDVTSTAFSPYSGYNKNAVGDYGYGMATSDVNYNMKWALAKNDDNDHVWVKYPSTIYVDKEEKLEDLGYYYQYHFHYGNSGNSDYHQYLFHSAMGFYPESGQNWYWDANNYVTGNNTNISAISAKNGSMRKFFSNYSLACPTIPLGSKKNQNVTNVYTWGNGDNLQHYVSSMEGANYNSNSHGIVEAKMKGSGSLIGGSDYVRYDNAPIFATYFYAFFQSPQVKYQWHLTSFTDVATAKAYGTKPEGYDANAVTDDIKIHIEIYDKSGLLSSMQMLDRQYDAVGSQMSVTNQGEFEKFRTRVTNLLSKRETTQTEINAMKKEVDEYVFDLEVAKPTLGTATSPIRKDYTGSAYTINDLWAAYSQPLNNAGDTLANYFTGPVIRYARNETDTKVEDPDGANYGNKMENAGYYSLEITPMSADTYGIYRAGGTAGDIKVRYLWQGTDRNSATIWFRINTARLTVKLPDDGYSVGYNGDSPNTIVGLRQGDKDPTFEMVAQDKNPIQILLSNDYMGPNWGAWQDMGLTDSVEIQGIGTHTIYYAVYADNHNDDVVGTFTVTVTPATVDIKVNSHTVTYGDLMESSEDLFDILIADDTPNILDSTTKAKTLEYLQRFFTFQVKTNDGSVLQAGTRTPKGEYTVDVSKTAEGESCIAGVNFVDGSNAKAYVVNPKSINVVWTDSENKWYDNARGHRPTADIVDKSQIFDGDIVDLTSTGVAGDGTSLDDPNVTVPLDNNNAKYAGNYVATVATTNANYTISNNEHPFQILKRKISISIGDRQREYASGGATADDVLAEYKNTILSENTDGKAYVATLDNEIVGKTGSDSALLDAYSVIFDVNIVSSIDGEAIRTPDNKYFKVGTHVLQFVNKNNPNYEITSSVNGEFEVLPALLVVSNGSLPSMTYNGDYQNIVLDKYTALSLSGYEKDHINDETVTVQYSETGADGSWRDECYQIKNVIESGKRVYYKVTATNHTTAISSFTQEMSPATISIVFTKAQQDVVYYGDSKFDSASITQVLGIEFKEYNRGLNPAQVFEFYLLNPETHLRVTTVNELKSAYYNVQWAIRADQNELEDNYSVSFENNANENAYFVTKKPLRVNWTQTGAGWSGDNYTFSNSNPVVFPTAGANEGVVDGDAIHFEAVELLGRYVDTYTAHTALTTQYNMDRYEIVEEDVDHEFKIVPLDIRIIVDPQRATYGRAQEVPIGALVDPVANPTAIWDYAEGSATFYEDHFRNYKFFTTAKSEDGSLMPVDRYPIGWLPNDEDGMDGSIRKNYNLTIANEDTAYFYIDKATIHYTGREYNIDVDNEDESPIISIDDLIMRVSTGIASLDDKIKDDGLNSVFSVIKMSDKFVRTLDYDYDDSNLQWVNETTYYNEPNRYYVWFIVEGNTNFNEFRAKVELNLLTNWITVTLGNGVTVEYGNEVDNDPNSANYTFANLDIQSITGFKDNSGMALELEDAKIELMKYVRFIVGAGDLNSEIDLYTNVGDYSIFMQKLNNAASDYENFRFYPRVKGGETSNINAYHIVPKVISIQYGDVDEVYGSHGNSHTEFTLLGVLPNDESKVRVELVHSIANVPNNENASMVGGHAHTVGTYTIYARNLVGSSNYVFDDNDESRYTNFTISPKTLHITLTERAFTYGVQNASLDPQNGINYALNRYSDTPYYEIVDESKAAFVGSDKRTDIFEMFFEATGAAIPSNFNYLPVSGEIYSYIINARLADTDVAKNYSLSLADGTSTVIPGELTINPATLAFTLKELPRMYFNADYQDVDFNYNWIVAQGDADYNKNENNVKIWFRQLAHELDRDTDPPYIEGTEFKIKDAGKYELQVKIQAPNHKEFESETITLFVDKANVTITLTPVSKVYGDQLGDFTASSLSNWIKANGHLKIESTRPSSGAPIVEDITKAAANDFIFYVVDPNNSSEDDPELPIGSYTNNVGKYRIHHKFAPGALANNYVVNYANNCNVDAYEITKREMSIHWLIKEDDVNWNSLGEKEYYYTGERPTLIARFKPLTEGDYVTLDVKGNGADYNYAVGDYLAYVEMSSMDVNHYADNYNFINTTCNYSIIPRPITVKIDNQGGEAYGSYGLNWSDYLHPDFTVIDGVTGQTATLTGNPIELYLNLDGIDLTGKTYLPVGEYDIMARFSGDKNYDPSTEYGTFFVVKAQMSINSPNSLIGKHYLGLKQEFDLKELLSKLVDSNTFVEEDDMAIWKDATVTVTQGGVEVANPYYDKAGSFTISYTISADNYASVTREWTFEIEKGRARLEFANAVTSVYGDSITYSIDKLADLSNKIIAESGVGYDKNADVLSVDFADLGRFFIVDYATNNKPVNAQSYTIGFELNEKHADNFDVVTGYGNYIIDPKELNIIWTLNSNDDYVYNNGMHSVNAKLDGFVEGEEDTVNAIFNSNSEKNAGVYTAILFNFSGNDNYRISEDNVTRSFKWEINPRPIEVEWTVGEYEYNGNEHVPSVTYKQGSGLCVGDTYGGFVVTGAINAGVQTAYVTTVSGNYTVSNNEQTFTIAPKPINLIWNDTQFVYDGTIQSPSVRIDKNGLIAGDDEFAIQEIGGAQKNAGNYTASIVNLGNNNYVAINNTIDFVIAPKEIEIHWGVTDLPYNGAEQAPTYVTNGVVKGDDVDLIIAGKGTDANSSYTATVTGVSNPNYLISNKSATKIDFNISKSINEFVEMPAIGTNLKELPWTNESDIPKAKFGETVIKYYTNKECTKEYKGDPAKAKEGTYWIKAYVEGTSNYDAIESAVIEVNIDKGFNKAAAASLISISAVMLIALLVLTLVINSKKKKGGRA